MTSFRLGSGSGSLRGRRGKNIGEILVKELRGQHVGWDMYQDVQVNGKDGMSSEEGKAYISGKLLMSKDERLEYLFPRLHQADCVPWLKALIFQGSNPT